MATEWSSIFKFRRPLIIEAQNVTKSYTRLGQKIPALRDVSLRVGPGTLNVIIGPSGSGKTTLLHILAGLIQPDSGSVLFHGLELTKAEDSVLRILREEFISVAYQEQSLVRHMTVRENIQLPLTIIGLGDDESRQASDRVLQTLGLPHRGNHLAEEISGGERQIANMARALAKRPILVLADEPTANLDQGRIAQLLETIQKYITTHGTTFIITTHDPLLTEHADRVLEMRDGILMDVGIDAISRLALLPRRYLSAQVFHEIEPKIRGALLGRSVIAGQVVEALGTNYTVTHTDDMAEGAWGVVTEDTRITLEQEPLEGQTLQEPPQPGTGAEDDDGDVTTRISGSLQGLRRPLLHYTILKLTTLPAGALLVGLGLAIWLRLGVWTSNSTALGATGLLMILLAILYAPRDRTSLRMPRGGMKIAGAFGENGIQWTVGKSSLCDFCGVAWAGEVCHMCGRKMCDECWPRVIREPTFCSDHLSCHICGREEVKGQLYTAGCAACLICGTYVCSTCLLDGVCLECATEKGIHRRPPGESKPTGDGEGRETPPLETLIIQPVQDLPNSIAREVRDILPAQLNGAHIAVGQDLEVLGMETKAVATLPLGGGRVTNQTHINLVNRQERDGSLREMRKGSGFFVCYYPGCDYPIGRFCCVCLRTVCPNHSTRCKTCGCPVCEDHQVSGECTRCIPRPIATGARATLRQMLGPLKFPIAAIVTAYVMLWIMLYGEPLRAIDPSLPLVIYLLYFLVPTILLFLTRWWSQRGTLQAHCAPKEEAASQEG